MINATEATGEPRRTPMPNVVGDLLRALRLKHRRSQRELGETIGYSNTMVSDMEMGSKYSERYCIMFMITICQADCNKLLELMRKQTIEVILNRGAL